MFVLNYITIHQIVFFLYFSLNQIDDPNNRQTDTQADRQTEREGERLDEDQLYVRLEKSRGAELLADQLREMCF